jgi:hypothetical protein
MLKYIITLLVFCFFSSFVYAAPATKKSVSHLRYKFIDFTEDGIVLIDSTNIIKVKGIAGFYLASFVQQTDKGQEIFYAGFDCSDKPNFFFMVPDQKGDLQPTKKYPAVPNTMGYKMFSFVCKGRK